MRKQYHIRFVLPAAALFYCGLFASAAPAQDAVKPRYGYKMGGQYSYQVTLTADLPSEELTDTGVLHYEVPASADGQFTLKCTGRLKSSTKPKTDAPPSSSGPVIVGPPRGPRGARGTACCSPAAASQPLGRAGDGATNHLRPPGQTRSTRSRSLASLPAGKTSRVADRSVSRRSQASLERRA